MARSLKITRCAGHPDGRGYRDPAAPDIWRCIECEEEGRALATLHVDDYQDVTDPRERRRLSARLYQRRFNHGRGERRRLRAYE